MSDEWKESYVRALFGQVEAVHEPPEEKHLVRSVIVQVEHEGGGGEPRGNLVSKLFGQIEYKVGNLQVQIRSLVIQVECEVGYPIRPLTRYAPRILIDLFLDSGTEHYSTESCYIEEL